MKEEDRAFISQLISALDEATKKLSDAYNQKDYEKFSKSKKFVLDIQNKISEIAG